MSGLVRWPEADAASAVCVSACAGLLNTESVDECLELYDLYAAENGEGQSEAKAEKGAAAAAGAAENVSASADDDEDL